MATKENLTPNVPKKDMNITLKFESSQGTYCEVPFHLDDIERYERTNEEIHWIFDWIYFMLQQERDSERIPNPVE